MNMKQFQINSGCNPFAHLPAFGLALIFLAVSVDVSKATLIAADSFWSTATGGQYTNGGFVGKTAEAGTTGFAGTAWLSGTGTIVIDPLALNHGSLVGSPQDGSVNFRVSHPRNAERDVSAAVPTSSSYFLSGLVRANAANPFTVDLDYFAVGFLDENAVFAVTTADINTGMHLGIRRNDSLGGLRLTAFGGGQFFDLGPANTDTDYMIALELQVNAGGPETLNAWASANGSPLSPVLSGQSLESFAAVGDLGKLVLQQSFGDANQSSRGYADEVRLGTALSDVAMIPEPSSFLLLGLSLVGFRLLGGHRRRRT
jgi:hypothetical protein